MSKITRSRLKELIGQTIKEIDFKNQQAFDAYNKKHKMRPGTKVSIGGKDTTAGDASTQKSANEYEPGSYAHKLANRWADDDESEKSTDKKGKSSNDDAAKDLGFNDANDVITGGMADDIGEFMDSIPDNGQDFNEADELLNYIRDNEQGVRDDDDDVVDNYRKKIGKILNTSDKFV